MLWLLVALSDECIDRARKDTELMAGMALLPSSMQPPAGAVAVRAVRDIAGVHRLLRRASQLSSSRPDAIPHTFQKKTAAMLKTTEPERLVVEQVRQ